MEYKNIDSQHILVRLDPNDEIVTSLMQVAKEENIGLAMVQGLGAVKKVVMGVYNVPEQHYKANTLEGAFEMLADGHDRHNGGQALQPLPHRRRRRAGRGTRRPPQRGHHQRDG